MRYLALSLSLSLFAAAATAQDIAPRTGWTVAHSTKTHEQLVADVRSAIKESGLIVVTQAGPTKAAAKRGIEIPGNLVIGAFNNDYAVRVLETSTPAMIEAPIRFYVTENADQTATLSYKTPSFVFAPYMDTAAPGLSEIAAELDGVFAAIAESAIASSQ